jgi:hypothetical protein
MNYAKARDWEVIENARRGYEEAIAEASRRGLDISPRASAGMYRSAVR